MCKYCNLPGQEMEVECLNHYVSARIDGNRIRIETVEDDVWGNVKIKFCPMCGERLVEK
jgi:hypothetical protein